MVIVGVRGGCGASRLSQLCRKTTKGEKVCMVEVEDKCREGMMGEKDESRNVGSE
jgi:hypothetical protein